MMKAELWTPGKEVEENVEKEREENENEAGGSDQWHFQNALFDDIKNSLKGNKALSSSLSRRRYACLACGEIKRWDQLTQHYKKMVEFDTMGIPAVPNQKEMNEKIYQHTALFFERNFSKDKMPTYKDHVPADGPLPTEEKSNESIKSEVNTEQGGIELKSSFNSIPPNTFIGQHSGLGNMTYQMSFSQPSENLYNGFSSVFKDEPISRKEVSTRDIVKGIPVDNVDDTVTVKDELLPMCNSSMYIPSYSLSSRLAPLSSTPPPLQKRPRKRKQFPNSSISTSTPSQSRRFYKCLGCGSSKRWDRLTDHYRKYVVFGPLGEPWVPNLETMTPEQYVHTLAFRDQGFSSDRMPQYKDHTESTQDNDDDFCIEDEAQDILGFNESDEINSGEVCEPDESANMSVTEVDMVQEGKEKSDKGFREPVFGREKKPPEQHPNFMEFWNSKIFSDVKIVCSDGEVITHRLVLAARNPLFYQVLSECVNEEFSVIIMPDQSTSEVNSMLKQYYEWKPLQRSHPLAPECPDKQIHNFNLDNSCPPPCKIAKVQIDREITDKKSESLIPITAEAFTSKNIDDVQSISDESVFQRNSASNMYSLDRLISKSGGGDCPTYSCKVTGCQFSVQSSLMCIKGHILTEHWDSLS